MKKRDSYFDEVFFLFAHESFFQFVEKLKAILVHSLPERSVPILEFFNIKDEF